MSRSAFCSLICAQVIAVCNTHWTHITLSLHSPARTLQLPPTSPAFTFLRRVYLWGILFCLFSRSLTLSLPLCGAVNIPPSAHGCANHWIYVLRTQSCPECSAWFVVRYFSCITTSDTKCTNTNAQFAPKCAVNCPGLGAGYWTSTCRVWRHKG